jgi:hypothetical protein
MVLTLAVGFGRCAEHLAARSLVELCLDPQFSDRFQQADRPKRGYIARILRFSKLTFTWLWAPK